MVNTTSPSKGSLIKNIYLYLVSFVALMMMIFSVADIINIGLKTYLFPKADNVYNYSLPCPVETSEPGNTSTPDKRNFDCSTKEQLKMNEENRIAQKQTSLVRDISFVLVAIPVFLFHWRIIRKKEEGV